MNHRTKTQKLSFIRFYPGQLGLICLVLIVLLMLTLTKASAAGVITVDSLADTIANDGACTLPEAILNANLDDQSYSTDCAAGSGADTITFSVSGKITLSSSLPDVSSQMTIDGAGQSVTISGNNSVRVVQVAFGDLELRNLTIADGNSVLSGGAIFVYTGTLKVANSTFVGNNSDGAGGAISASDFNTLTITNSTFVGNNATLGGAVYAKANNTHITNSTFSGNSASQGGAIYTRSGILTMQNTIVANSLSGGNCYFYSGTIAGDGNLVWGDTTCPGINADPKLLPLADNGGPTQTMALDTGSAALDAGDDAICSAAVGNPTYGAGGFDQRGVARPQGANCDIGAFEFVPDTTAPVITLNGDPEVTLLQGETYVEAGATVTDDDPAYSGTVSIGGDVVDTATPGIYIVTYDAPADAAGNVPTQVTRTVTVLSTQEAVGDVIDNINDLVDDGVLKPGQANGLIHPLDNAIRSLDKSNVDDACNQFDDFITYVNEKTPTPLDASSAADLIASAERIQASIGCQ